MEIKRSQEAIVQTSTVEKQTIGLSGGDLIAIIGEALQTQFPDKQIVSISWNTKIETIYSLDAGIGSQAESQYVNVLGATIHVRDFI